MDSKAAILDAARRLFAERGYNGATIREVAAMAGVSPAMVMKTVGSKEALYAAARPMDTDQYERELPQDGLGYELVRRILARRDDGEAEPWARALFLTQQSPDPELSRAEFHQKYLAYLAERVSDGPDKPQRVSQIACMLIGLASGVRTMRLLAADESDSETVVACYGGLIQSLVDGCPPPRRPVRRR
jgi:AcrR family transcriptional regulator